MAHTLNVYTVEFKDRESPTTRTAFLREGLCDPYSCLLQFCLLNNNVMRRVPDGAKESQTGDEITGVSTGKTFKIIRYDVDDDSRSICGLVEVGGYGRTGKLISAETGEEKTDIEKTDSTTEPFYFHFYVPDGMSTGLFIAQRIGIRGLKTCADVLLAEHARDYSHQFKFDVMGNRRALKAMIEGAIPKEIRITRRKSAQDSDAVMARTRIAGELIEEGAIVKVSVIPKTSDNLIIGTLKRLIADEGQPNDLIRFAGLEHPDSIEVVLEKGGRTQIMSISEPDENPIRFSLGSEVAIGSDGHPVYNQLKDYANKLSRDLIRELV